MPKRSKNSTDGAVFTYHERRNMDHGSTHIRLPGVALKSWDCCALGLTPPTDPVITPEGVMYEREAILRDLLRQKEENRKEEEHFAAKLIDAEVRKEAQRSASRRAAIEQFEKFQESTPAPLFDHRNPPASQDVSRQDENSTQSNFWLPSVQNKVQKAPKANQDSKKRKRSFRTRCPISKKPLRARDLISLKLVTNKQSGKGNSGETPAFTSAKFVCPVCQTSLVNAVKPIALRTGTVLCSQCVAKFVMKEKVDPHTSRDLDIDKDVIPIFNVGTAFAASAEDDPSSREASLYRPSAR